MKITSISNYILPLLLMFVISLPLCASGSGLEENETLLVHLDSVISSNSRLVNEKEDRISTLRGRFRKSRSQAEQLGAARQLYSEYIVYDSDSALYYASKARQLAAQIAPDDYNLNTECKLDEAFIYVVLGLNDQAMELLGNIDTSRLSPEVKSDYYELRAYAHSMRAVYLHSNKNIWREDLDRANHYRDSIAALNGSQDKWLWVPVALTLDSEKGDVGKVDVTRLKQIVDKAETPSRENAINAYWLARYYKAAGNKELMVRYMTLAATYDALIVNREIAALQELADYLFENGQVNRAYNYLLYADAQANLYHNRYRMVSLSDVLPGVREAYRTEIEKRDRRLSIYVWCLAALAVVLLASIGFIVLEMRKIRNTKNLLRQANAELNESVVKRDEAIKQLELANHKLSETNDRLCETNEKLSESNKQKLGILAYSFKLTTEYIHALEDYRKKLLKKYKVKKIDDLGVLINDPELLKDQYTGFYEGFDKMILSVFPEFVEEYNATVKDENKVSEKTIVKTKTLNTRLRIYALKRLGLTKSSDIAEMLNVSIRTVYNNKGTDIASEKEENG